MTQELFRTVVYSFQILGHFLDILLVLISNMIPFMVTEHTLYDLNHFNVLRHNLWPRHKHFLFYLGKCSMYTWKKKCAFCCCWMKCSKNVKWVKFDDSVVQVFYILTKFLSTCSINYWERRIEITNYNCGFIYFSF